MIALWLIVDERTASAKDRRSINDPAVSGAAPIESRPGFAALLDRVENNGVRVVLVEDASRFARDLVAQELGVLMLIKRGMKVITASGDDLTDATDPSRIMMNVNQNNSVN